MEKDTFEMSFYYILDKENPPNYEEEFYEWFERTHGKIKDIKLVDEDPNPHEVYVDIGSGKWILETYWIEEITTETGETYIARHYYTSVKELLNNDYIIHVTYRVEVEKI